MSDITLNSTIHVDEDTAATFAIRELLAQAGYVTDSPLEVSEFLTQLPDGEYADADTPLLGLADAGTLYVRPGAWQKDYNGEFTTYQLIIEGTNGDMVTLELRVVVDPVNDAPTGTDRAYDLATRDAVVLGRDAFGFADAVEHHGFRSVTITSLPAAGAIVLDGVPVAAGTEVSVADLDAGKLKFVPSATSGGIVEMGFHVRDDGGTAGTGAQDTSVAPNHLTFKVPVPPAPPVEPEQPEQPGGGGTTPPPSGGATLAKIGDTVWEDSNGNGIQDQGEAGIAGVAVALRDSAGNVVASTTTDAAGHYGFDVGGGTYTVALTLPQGYTVTTKNAGTDRGADSDFNADGTTSAFTVVKGDVNNGADAGLVRAAATLGNRVWLDSDGDGIQDSGESGVGGVKVTLLDQDGKAIATTKTDGSGTYAFTGLKAGTYSIQFDKSALPAGYVITQRDAGADDARDSDIDANGLSHQVTLAAGEVNNTIDAGVARAATIGDRVWIDSDGDGIQDSNEAGAANVAVTLKNSKGDIVATTQTDAAGNYKFTVAAGTYSVSVKAPDTYGFTKQNATSASYDSNADAAGNLGTVTVAAGETAKTLDAGLVQAAIRSTVWEDLDFDGVQDAGEAGVRGVTVRLYDANHNLKATTVTAADGSYTFGKLAAGSYSVEVVKPTGYYATKANVGSDATDSDFTNIGTTSAAGSGVFKLAAGEQKTSLDAGLYRKASIGDKVWRDANHNGVQDSGEEGIGKIKVMLYDAATNKLLETTTTDSKGNYLFDNLDPGSYYLKFDKTGVKFTDSKGYTYAMNDWKWGVKDTGSNDRIDSDVKGDGISKTGLTQTDATVLTSGENDMSWDAAITPIAIDLNGDGIHTIARADSHADFDLLGTGTTIRSGWLSAGDAFLAVDTNGNGTIDGIGELFGGASKGSGFAKLASFDSNGDGYVDAHDADFAALTLWQDANGNGRTDAGELITLAQAGVTSLTVAFEELPFLDAQGNLHLERSSAIVDGRAVSMTDVYFNVAAADVAAAGLDVTNMATLIGQSPVAA